MRAALREWISRLGGVFGRGRDDRDLHQELQLHLELVEQDLRRQGLSSAAAAREARVRVGRPTPTMELLRDRRGIPSLSAFWLDAKLGLRMLRKHWGLTLIGGLTLVVAMTIGASIFNLIHALRGTTLPVEEGDRVVVIQPFDPETRQIRDSSREDFARWRAAMRTVENVSAFRAVQRNLIAAGAPPVPVTVAEMSASGFQLFRTAPHLGRFLLPEDELTGAPPVLVIGYNVWHSQFSADPSVLGRQVRLDGVPHTIVGVMPRRFAFPVNHRYWTSLRPDGVDRVVVFARLAAGASVEVANAEVQPIGLQQHPLQPRVVPYVSGLGLAGGPGDPILAFLPFALPLLLVPPCANIAILIYARTVARQGEFAARSALGASRGRIVSQLLIEVLLLAAGAAAVAVLLASQTGVLLQNILAFGDRPFWLDFDLSYQTILFAAGLAAIAAMIAGGIPAMRATGCWKLSGMHALKGGSNPRLGNVWTAVVVAQVALSVAVVPIVTELAWDTMKPAVLGPGFDARPFLTARLAMNGTDARFRALREAVVRQLKAEPGVTAVTMSESVPFEERDVLIEVEGAAERKSVSLNHVDEAFFETFAVPLLAGRFNPAQGAVLVNRSFALQVFGGGNPVGRRIRPMDAPAYDIVGVVGDFPESHRPAMYRALDARRQNAGAHEVRLTMRAGRTVPPDLGKRLQEIAAALEPSAWVDDLQTLDEIYWRLSIAGLAGGGLIASLTLAAVLFSVAGIYTSMAFALVERRREIGIRAALGAPPARLIAGAFRQVLLPVGVGMVLGSVAAIILESYLSPLLFDETGARPLPWILPAAEAFVFLTALIALCGPVRRALRVDPFATLRES